MSIERIDQDLCNGCRLCVDACPMDCIRLDTIVEDREEFPACRMSCPAGVDIRSYIYLLRNGMIEKAIDVLRESLPIPTITGRVCPHPCESTCSRSEVDEAVNINALERFTADYWLKEKAQPVHKILAAKTAIIGSGPAGLACAYFLVKYGYPVTVFEAMPSPGGMLRAGIPEFRLPKDVLNHQIDYIRDMGVEFKTGVRIGKDIPFENLIDEYDATFISTGSQLSRKLQLEGSEFDGVFMGLDFLRDINLKGKATVNGRVVVIGGGNVAVDAALSALRLGAEDVQLICLECRDEMPAYEEEITQATDEGITVNVSWGPKKILGSHGKVTGIEVVCCTRVFDEGGNFNPCYDEKETMTIEADMIIIAIGQIPDISFVPNSITMTQDNTIQVDPITLETSLSGVFAGGDATIPGGSSVVEAIGMGRQAAISIERYLNYEDLKAGRYLKPKRVIKPPKEGIARMPRQSVPTLPIKQRSGNFEEVKMAINADTMLLEAQRCMTCGSRAHIAYPDDCQLCLACERDCPQIAIYVSPERKELPMMAWG
jgi:NADPH-dependent glutamate synthase beta subunit-like oxidoreductase/NAD-dependent dihydropyrimidine dehydrogenase PreA subunit